MTDIEERHHVEQTTMAAFQFLRPGEHAPKSAFYEVVDTAGNSTGVIYRVKAGKRLPPTNRKGQRFVMHQPWSPPSPPAGPVGPGKTPPGPTPGPSPA